MTEAEKKAEESLEKRKGEYWCTKTDNVYIPYTEGYKDGYAEGKPKWHDLRENSKDLPKENGHYWCKWDDGSYCTEHYFQDYGFGSYVIAWCELPKFEE